MKQVATVQENRTQTSASEMRLEYQAYLVRATLAGALPGEYLTFEEFCAEMKRWTIEYHPAWLANNTALMAELEGRLMLSVGA